MPVVGFFSKNATVKLQNEWEKRLRVYFSSIRLVPLLSSGLQRVGDPALKHGGNAKLISYRLLFAGSYDPMLTASLKAVKLLGLYEIPDKVIIYSI